MSYCAPTTPFSCRARPTRGARPWWRAGATCVLWSLGLFVLSGAGAMQAGGIERESEVRRSLSTDNPLRKPSFPTRSPLFSHAPQDALYEPGTLRLASRHADCIAFRLDASQLHRGLRSAGAVGAAGVDLRLATRPDAGGGPPAPVLRLTARGGDAELAQDLPISKPYPPDGGLEWEGGLVGWDCGAGCPQPLPTRGDVRRRLRGRPHHPLCPHLTPFPHLIPCPHHTPHPLPTPRQRWTPS